jgi:hypothetical protein
LLGPLAITAASHGCTCDEELFRLSGTIVGVVCGAMNGLAEPDVQVRVVDAGGREHVATTDGNGAFRLDGVTPGPAQIVIAAREGERRVEVEVEVENETRLDDAYCGDVPADVGSISGCVCDSAAGAWVDGARVFVLEGETFATTDARGCFTLEGISPGSHTLQIEKGAFQQELPVVVSAGEETKLASPETCEPPDPEDETGAVAGRVCAPDGETWLFDASVFVDLVGGGRVETKTDVDGRYLLMGVPVGTQTVHVEKGSFSSQRTVEVLAGQTTTIPDDQCQLDDEPRIAVVTGQNDDVGLVLESIGIDPTSISTYNGVFRVAWGMELLEDYAVLSEYDILFINCGANGIDDYPALLLFPTVVESTLAIENLRRFVDEGGSLYASDEAYDLIERAWPDFIDFVGDDALIDAAQIGVFENDPVPVRIVEPGLRAAMGIDQFDIHFRYVLWAVIADVAPETTIYTRGDAPTDAGIMPDVPLTVGFSVGQGRVLYTTFHQEPGIESATEQLLRLLMFEL